MEQLAKRIDRCEDDIKILSKDVAENKTDTKYIRKVVEDFSKFIQENIKTLTNIQNELQNLNKNQDCSKQELEHITEKINKNEEAFKIDLRPIQKRNFENILTKVFMILSPIGMLALILYLIFGS